MIIVQHCPSAINIINLMTHCLRGCGRIVGHQYQCRQFATYVRRGLARIVVVVIIVVLVNVLRVLRVAESKEVALAVIVINVTKILIAVAY